MVEKLFIHFRWYMISFPLYILKTFSSETYLSVLYVDNTYMSSFATHLHTQNHSYTNIDTNLEILHLLPKGRKLNTAEQYEIYKHHTTQPNNILND